MHVNTLFGILSESEDGLFPEYAVHGNIVSDEDNEVGSHTSALRKILVHPVQLNLERILEIEKNSRYATSKTSHGTIFGNSCNEPFTSLNLKLQFLNVSAY